MICDDCKNNVNGVCKNTIEIDGTQKRISVKQEQCGIKNTDKKIDMR